MDRFNPLDKRNLGKSVANALLRLEPVPLPAPGTTIRSGFVGAGVYAIYYTGAHQPFPPYARLADANQGGRFERPIYVGKAIPEGARKAGIGLDLDPGPELFRRLREHATSIQQAENLDLQDFVCRYLVVDDIWIPLGESLLIRDTRPVWNLVVDGFGNHAPGSGRYNQQASRWDALHPGRPWVQKLLQSNALTAAEIAQEVELFLAGEKEASKSVEEAMADED